MRRGVLSLICLLAFVPVAFAQYSVGYSGEIMGMTRSFRDPLALGMGGTAMMQTESPYAALRNVSLSPFSQSLMNIGVDCQMYGKDVLAGERNVNAGVSYNGKDKYGVSVGLSLDRGRRYDVYDASGLSAKEYVPSSLMLSAGGAWRFMPWLSVGAAAKYINQSVAEGTAVEAFSFSAYASARFGSLMVSAGVSEIGPKVLGEYELPASVSAGASWSKAFGDHGVFAAGEADYYLKGAFRAAVGAQYGYKNMVFARAGYNLGGGSPVPGFFSVGLGGEYKRICLDLAYLLGKEMNNTICIGLSYKLK